jgi:AcrR family transcriptional regulator
VEASVEAQPRRLEGEKAQRIIEAMRASVAQRGAAGSTFDHVAREAGVSRGLLHYYFGTKERLLVEVVRADCEVRIERIERRLAGARSVDDVLAALVTGLEEFIEDEPAGGAVAISELITASRDSAEIRGELAELYRRWREHLGAALREKEKEGILTLRADAETVASVLFSLADGFSLQVSADPAWDRSASFALGVETARHLLTA